MNSWISTNYYTSGNDTKIFLQNWNTLTNNIHATKKRKNPHSLPKLVLSAFCFPGEELGIIL